MVLSYVKEAGGTMVGEKFAPLGTADFVPYISGLNPDAIDVICVGFFTRDARTLITALETNELAPTARRRS